MSPPRHGSILIDMYHVKRLIWVPTLKYNCQHVFLTPFDHPRPTSTTDSYTLRADMLLTIVSLSDDDDTESDDADGEEEERPDAGWNPKRQKYEI